MTAEAWSGAHSAVSHLQRVGSNRRLLEERVEGALRGGKSPREESRSGVWGPLPRALEEEKGGAGCSRAAGAGRLRSKEAGEGE